MYHGRMWGVTSSIEKIMIFILLLKVVIVVEVYLIFEVIFISEGHLLFRFVFIFGVIFIFGVLIHIQGSLHFDIGKGGLSPF